MTTPSKQDIASLKGSGLFDAEQYLETLSEEADGLHNQLAAAEDARLALTRMSDDLLNEVTQLKSRNAELAKSLDAAKKLTKQAETKLKTEIENERRTRFSESVTLTRMIEELKAENRKNRRFEAWPVEKLVRSERKNRRFEAWLVEKLVRSERKLKKYRRERTAFFSDSRSIVARAYFRLRPGQ
jgi:hypothetical protein